MAPEQARDAKHADIRSDIFSLGCTLFHVLTGRLPFQGDTVMAKLMARTLADAPPVSSLLPDVPSELDALVARMLSRTPLKRPQTPAEVATALAPFATAQALTAFAVATASVSPSLASASASAKPDSDLAFAEFLKYLASAPAQETGPLGQTIPDGQNSRRAEQPAGPGRRLQWLKRPRVAMTTAVIAAVLLVTTGLTIALRSRSSELAPAKTGATIAQAQPKPELEPRNARPAAASSAPTNAELPQDGTEPPQRDHRKRDLANVPVTPPDDVSTAKPPAANAAAPVIPKDALSAEELEAEKWRNTERQYAETLEPAETLVAAWDFRGALAALTEVQFSDQELAERLKLRQDEVRRLEELKERLIARINEANPPFKTVALMLRGAGGQVTNADQSGITVKRTTGKVEMVPWSDLSGESVSRAVQLTIDSKKADDWLAAGLLALAKGSPAEAERCMAQARSLGLYTDPYLTPLAAKAFAAATGQLDQGKYAEAEKALASIEEKYGKLPWVATRKQVIAATREKAKRGIHEAEAEKLYAEAAALFAQKEFFDVKPLVDKLKTEYPTTGPATDESRKPSLADLEKSTANLGRRLIVRQDAKGEFITIQAAVDAAPPDSLIEIQDPGPYGEHVLIPAEKSGITLRGKKGIWPVVTSKDAKGDVPYLLEVRAPGLVLERLVLSHAKPAGANPASCLFGSGSSVRMRQTVVCTAGGTAVTTHASLCEVENSVLIPGVRIMRNCTFRARNSAFHGASWADFTFAPSRFENCQLGSLTAGMYSPAQIASCTILGTVLLDHQESDIVDSVVEKVDSGNGNIRVDYCNLFGQPPFSQKAKPGKSCMTLDPQFRDKVNFDFRLGPKSPCLGKASDGGDIGCRYTPEMTQMIQVALDLRKRGIIKF